MKKLCSALGSLFLAIGILLTIIDYCSFDKDFYRKEYTADQTAQSIGMSDDDLFAATETLLDYLRDERDDIIVTVEVHGTEREIYNQRETLHMVDVKALYQNAITARNMLLIAGVICILISLTDHDKRGMLQFGYRTGISLLIAIILAIGFACIVDFDAFWVSFHEFFFDNDLWLLDPNTSIMINMFPSNFFNALVLRIVGYFTAIAAILGILIFMPFKRSKK